MILLGVGCSNLTYTPVPTPYPVDYIPTIIALTVQAGEEAFITPSPVVIQPDTPTPSPTATAEVQLATDGPSPTPPAIKSTSTTSPVPSATLSQDLNTSPTRRPTRTPTLTPTPPIPNAGVQISEPGPMSKVASPLELVANLHSFPSGTYHVEIWLEPLQPGGEPRLLFREVKKIISNPIDWIYLDPTYPLRAEPGVGVWTGQRVGVYDQFGQAGLGQLGRPDPAHAWDPRISPPPVTSPSRSVIREPTRNHLIQGGTAIVSGLAKPSEEILYGGAGDF